MVDQDLDPTVKRAVADAVVERASNELKGLVRELASALEPFPRFLGLSTVQAIEVEPSGVGDSGRGCVVVCPDGELYELVLRMLPGAADVGAVDQVEEMKEPDLSPGDYVAYAHRAVGQMALLLEDRRG